METPKIEIRNDITLDIAIGAGAASKTWKNTRIAWSALLGRLSRPVVTPETYRSFMAMSREDQGRIKDVGGFVGGFLSNGRRDRTSVLYRQVVALDIDFSHANLWWDFSQLFDCTAAIHSTHKSCPDKPRHRLLIPLDREVTPEEYQAVARRIAGDLNIDLFDPSTFEVNRLMFWPTVSCDMEYYFEYQDGPVLCADDVLGRYHDWHDTSQWPTCSGADTAMGAAVRKQEDPEAKKGIVGVFCRAHPIEDAIARFLPDVYEPAGEGRYTYLGGTTAAGLIIYDGKFAYSHHGTDPAGGQLCNAFDLVRIHRFGHLDPDQGRRDTPGKSYRAMEEFAAADPETRRQMGEERFADARYDFAEPTAVDTEEGEPDTSWVTQLSANAKGEYESSAANFNTILQNDAHLKDAFRLNTFDNRRYVCRTLPWRKVDRPEPLRDVDYSGVRNYIECVYGITGTQKVDDALALEFERHRYHPITDYIGSLSWDGKPRVDTLLIDYFGADDNTYTRAAIRKTLCAAVARVFEPGVKFDTALILVGAQGTYKSTFVKKLGRDWFSDTFTTVQGKESFEQIQGAWLVEIAELSGLKKAEVETIKHYISKREDSFRPAYGRVVETYRRQCVFFGTTNNKDFLRDPTGNRRFLPVDVHPARVTRSVAEDLTPEEVDQIWAEAYVLYKAGEPLYLSGESDAIAKDEQRRHSEVDERRGIIEEFLDMRYPKGWDDMDLFDRRRWLDDPLSQKGEYLREYVCVAEVWCECLGKDKNDMSRYSTREVNEILRTMEGWEAASSTRNFPIYGKQKYYRRVDLL